MKNMLALSQERFSARKFTSEAVSQEDLDYIMECVRMAPSAVNKQPWKWLIVRSDEAKQKLQECYDREWFRSAHLCEWFLSDAGRCAAGDVPQSDTLLVGTDFLRIGWHLHRSMALP